MIYVGRRTSDDLLFSIWFYSILESRGRHWRPSFSLLDFFNLYYLPTLIMMLEIDKCVLFVLMAILEPTVAMHEVPIYWKFASNGFLGSGLIMRWAIFVIILSLYCIFNSCKVGFGIPVSLHYLCLVAFELKYEWHLFALASNCSPSIILLSSTYA